MYLGAHPISKQHGCRHRSAHLLQKRGFGGTAPEAGEVAKQLHGRTPDGRLRLVWAGHVGVGHVGVGHKHTTGVEAYLGEAGADAKRNVDEDGTDCFFLDLAGLVWGGLGE